ncbi:MULTISPECIES: YegJ family protein [Chitinophagaceae]
MQKRIICLLSGLLLFASCRSNTKENKTERNGNPDIYEVQQDDAEIDSARMTLANFDQALAGTDPAYSEFTLKVRFKEASSNGIEHMWVSDIKKEKDAYYGILNNEPEFIKKVRLGDTVRIDKSDISDWMFLEGSKLHGGYTIRVLRNKMSPSERKIFDKEQGMSFE